MWLARRYGITDKIKTERGKDIKTDRKNNKDKDEKRKYTQTENRMRRSGGRLSHFTWLISF